MRLLLFVSALLDLSFILGGHSYDFDGLSRGDSGGDHEESGIGVGWILAVLFLALFTVGLLVSLDPSGAIAKLKAVAPRALIVVLIAAPLIGWAASSRSEEKSLIVERATGLTGAPELLVSLADEDLNTLRTTNGTRVVRVECVGRDGQVVLDAEQKWPFINEPGYDYPHAHQAASPEQLQRADRCRLRGTRIRLEADVTGALPR